MTLARLRREDGFTLMELMTAMVIGSVVLTALMTVFINGVTGASRVSDRVEAAQRGRVAMDRITSLLDSQVCMVNYDTNLNTEVWVSPVVSGDDNAVVFYGDLSGASDTPDKYQLVYDPTKKTITELRFDGSGKLPNVTFPGWPGAPTAKRVVATNIVPSRSGGVPSGTQQPIFRYYHFNGSGAVDPAPLATPLSAADAAGVVRVDVSFQAIPERTKTEDPRSAQLTGQGNVLTANPVNNSVC